MRTLFPGLFVAFILIAEPATAAEEVEFTTDDGVHIFGDLYRTEGATNGPLILLFHQAGGDARGEYEPLVGKLVAAGFNAMAIDQRIGGDRFGGVNRTIAELGDSEYEYCDAYPDLAAALKHAKSLGFEDKIIVWGSSYSAALIFQLAAKNPDDIDAVIAFSPASGGPLAECAPKLYSADLKMPVLALRPVGEMEVASVATQLERFNSEGHATYVADPGVHGSSMLNAERVGASTDATWTVVLDFLASSSND